MIFRSPRVATFNRMADSKPAWGTGCSVFTMINGVLSKAIEHADVSGWVFKLFTRILPVPQAIVRGVPIRIIIPLNHYGTFVAFKNWETREPETLDWIDNFERDAVFFDVGASFGNETLYAALKKGGPRKTICFDLDLLASFNLALNLQINNVRNVEQYHLGVSDQPGDITASEHTNYACVPGRPKYDRVSHKTWSISLDEFVRITGEDPDYLKIDVDGHEEKVIQGMRRTLSSTKLKSILVEVNEKTKEAVTHGLQASGFEKMYESPEDGSNGTRNLVFSRALEVSRAHGCVVALGAFGSD